MTNTEFTSVWTPKETSAFEDALERRRKRRREAESAFNSPETGRASANPGVQADVQPLEEQSGGLMIRIAGMAVGVVALAAIATFGMVG